MTIARADADRVTHHLAKLSEHHAAARAKNAEHAAQALAELHARTHPPPPIRAELDALDAAAKNGA